MPDQEHYAKAPVTEAVIDFRVILSEEFNPSWIQGIRDALADEYPEAQELFTGEVKFEFGEQSSASTHKELLGVHLRANNQKYIIQARSDGFMLSVLPPYQNWESFQAEALRLWQTYRSFFPVESITRVAVRYINRIDIPFPTDGSKLEQSDYFRTYPKMSDEYLFSDLDAMFMTVIIPQADLEAAVILKQARTEPQYENTAAIILDIDLFTIPSREPWLVSDENKTWEYLELLHLRKNHIFEASITERTRELIR